jgi:hypothetical protein
VLLEGLEVRAFDADGETVHLAPVPGLGDSSLRARSVAADLLVLATGYAQRFPFLHGPATHRATATAGATAPAGDGPLLVGARVTLVGLVAKSELNGSIGVVGEEPTAGR